MANVVVVGGGLPGMAAAGRLARAGHTVTLLERRDHLGGHHAEPGVLTPVWTFPAPLRDLLRKTGRAFTPEFTRHGLELVPAPPAVHEFADGTTWAWPTERAEQWQMLHDRYGAGTAARWRDLVDRYGEVWQLLRPLGLEDELRDRRQIAAHRERLQPRRTVEHVARELAHPHLGELVRDTARRIGSDPDRTPNWLAARLAVERTFGRWLLVDDAGAVQPMTTVLDVLTERLATRGVRVLTGFEATGIEPGRAVLAGGERFPADAVISTVDPWTHDRLAPARHLLPLPTAALVPAWAPTITQHRIPGHQPEGEHVRHTATGPVITYRRRVAAGTEITVHDHTRPVPRPGHGVRWAGARTWLRLPAVRTPERPGLYVASAAGRGGNEPWAQLLTGALATYAAHEDLTGEDIRPTNRAYRP